MAIFSQALRWGADLLSKYDLAVSRYTFYPAAPQFHNNFSDQDFYEAVARSNLNANDLLIRSCSNR